MDEMKITLMARHRIKVTFYGVGEEGAMRVARGSAS